MTQIISIHRIIKSITENPFQNSAGIIISKLFFKNYIRYLVNTCTLTNLRFIKKQKEENFKIALTFDDGFIDQYRDVFPILEENKIKATFFIVTRCTSDKCFVRPIDLFYYLAEKYYGKKIKIDLLGEEVELLLNIKEKRITEIKDALKYKSLEVANKIIESIASALNIKLTDSLLRDINKQLYMQKEHIRELVIAGHEIGNHGHTHQAFSSLSEKELLTEMSQSKEIIKNIIGIEKQVFAYPYGGLNSYNDFTNDFIIKNNFSCCCTNTGFTNDNTSFLLHRTDINTLNLDK